MHTPFGRRSLCSHLDLKCVLWWLQWIVVDLKCALWWLQWIVVLKIISRIPVPSSGPGFFFLFLLLFGLFVFHRQQSVSWAELSSPLAVSLTLACLSSAQLSLRSAHGGSKRRALSLYITYSWTFNTSLSQLSSVYTLLSVGNKKETKQKTSSNKNGPWFCLVLVLIGLPLKPLPPQVSNEKWEAHLSGQHYHAMIMMNTDDADKEFDLMSLTAFHIDIAPPPLEFPRDFRETLPRSHRPPISW